LAPVMSPPSVANTLLDLRDAPQSLSPESLHSSQVPRPVLGRYWGLGLGSWVVAHVSLGLVLAWLSYLLGR
jgi:hypothetical protein